jgi:hypothetical protein
MCLEGLLDQRYEYANAPLDHGEAALVLLWHAVTDDLAGGGVTIAFHKAIPIATRQILNPIVILPARHASPEGTKEDDSSTQDAAGLFVIAAYAPSKRTTDTYEHVGHLTKVMLADGEHNRFRSMVSRVVDLLSPLQNALQSRLAHQPHLLYRRLKDAACASAGTAHKEFCLASCLLTVTVSYRFAKAIHAPSLNEYHNATSPARPGESSPQGLRDAFSQTNEDLYLRNTDLIVVASTGMSLLQ